MKNTVLSITTVIAALVTSGCIPLGQGGVSSGGTVPPPLEQYLPSSLKIHSFTEMRELKNGRFGIDAYIQAVDPWGEPTKAFGNFRMELYEFRKFHHEKKGKPVEAWPPVQISKPGRNQEYWDHHTRSYHFRLGMVNRIPPGRRMVLQVSYQGQFTERLIVENVIVSKK